MIQLKKNSIRDRVPLWKPLLTKQCKATSKGCQKHLNDPSEEILCGAVAAGGIFSKGGYDDG